MSFDFNEKMDVTDIQGFIIKRFDSFDAEGAHAHAGEYGQGMSVDGVLQKLIHEYPFFSEIAAYHIRLRFKRLLRPKIQLALSMLVKEGFLVEHKTTYGSVSYYRNNQQYWDFKKAKEEKEKTQVEEKTRVTCLLHKMKFVGSEDRCYAGGCWYFGPSTTAEMLEFLDRHGFQLSAESLKKDNE